MKFVCFNSTGSVICEAQVVMAPVSDSNILAVLEEVNRSGKLGNLSVVPNSLETSDVPG